MQQVLLKPKMPPLNKLNSLELVDKELRVFSLTADDTPEWIKADFLRDTHYDDISMLTFFYHPGADAVVLNRSHKDADFYELLVTAYLETTPKRRQQLKEQIPANTVGTAIDLLDLIIEKRNVHGGH